MIMFLLTLAKSDNKTVCPLLTLLTRYWPQLNLDKINKKKIMIREKKRKIHDRIFMENVTRYGGRL